MPENAPGKDPSPESQGFDSLAAEYDETFSHTLLGRLLRQRVRLCAPLSYSPLPTKKVLELNCGTGEDAIWLAEEGFEVLATDQSREMVAVTRQKVLNAGLDAKITVQECSFSEIGPLPENHFDLIFSNFGGLNCIPPNELESLCTLVFSKLKPGGQFIAVVMGRFCGWETIYFLFKGKPREAFRRLNSKAVLASLLTSTQVFTWYYSPAEFYQCANQFWSNGQKGKPEVYPIGFWLPPSYLHPFFEKRPRFLKFLNWLEMHFSPAWLSHAADHFLIRLQKP